MKTLYTIYRQNVLCTDLKGTCGIESFTAILVAKGVQITKAEGFGLKCWPIPPDASIQKWVNAYSQLSLFKRFKTFITGHRELSRFKDPQ